MSPRPTVLLVVRPELAGTASRALLGHYRVVATDEPFKALALIEWERADVVVGDAELAELNGVELLGRVARLFPPLPRILIAALDAGAILDAVNRASISRIVPLPLQGTALRQAVDAAVAHAEAVRRALSAERVGRREEALGRLEARYPNLSRIGSRDPYQIDGARLVELRRRFATTPLAALLD